MWITTANLVSLAVQSTSGPGKNCPKRQLSASFKGSHTLKTFQWGESAQFGSFAGWERLLLTDASPVTGQCRGPNAGPNDVQTKEFEKSFPSMTAWHSWFMWCLRGCSSWCPSVACIRMEVHSWNSKIMFPRAGDTTSAWEFTRPCCEADEIRTAASSGPESSRVGWGWESAESNTILSGKITVLWNVNDFSEYNVFINIVFSRLSLHEIPQKNKYFGT